MTKTSKTALTLITVALALGLARAEGVPSFASLDADGNGRVSAGEAAAHRGLRELMPEYDRDNDGHLDPAEYNALLDDAVREIRQASTGEAPARGTQGN